MVSSVKPLTSRTLDFIYVIFFSIHIPAFFLVDSQALFPETIRPLGFFTNWYLNSFNDPIIGGAIGDWEVGGWTWVWIKSFLWLEAVYQVPMFFLGIINLRSGKLTSLLLSRCNWETTDNKKFYPWLMIYGASTATTLLPAIAIIMTAPVGEVGIRGVQLSYSQRLNALSSFVPFLIIPLTMAIDMALRISKLIQKDEVTKEE